MRKLTSLDHPIVKHLAKLRLNRDYRYEHKSLVIPGVKSVSELVSGFSYQNNLGL